MPPRRYEVDDAASFTDLLKAMVDHEVDFIVVGGVAEILAGSPVVTVDLDIVHDVSKQNISRLLTALRKLNARYYSATGVARPDNRELAARERHRLLTDSGLLNVLRTIDGTAYYPDLVKTATTYKVENFQVTALDLESLIEIRERAKSPEDRYSLRFLRCIRRLRSAELTEIAVAS